MEPTIEQWKAIAEGLWQALDDIDTWDDRARNDHGMFRRHALNIAHRRHMYATSDGYELTNWRVPK